MMLFPLVPLLLFLSFLRFGYQFFVGVRCLLLVFSFCCFRGCGSGLLFACLRVWTVGSWCKGFWLFVVDCCLLIVRVGVAAAAAAAAF